LYSLDVLNEPLMISNVMIELKEFKILFLGGEKDGKTNHP
jgi:hypothetical protein